MNILIMSAGRRVSLIQYFKQELNEIGAKVIAADSSSLAPALYFADHYEIVPPITAPNYIEQLLQICDKYQIKALLSLIDPELSVLAPHKDEFSEHGVKLILSDPDTVDLCFDKKRTHDVLSQAGIPVIPTYCDGTEVLSALRQGIISFPLFVKRRLGSGSVGNQIVHSESELITRLNNGSDDIIQPYVDGVEYGTDVYVDLVSGQPISIFARKKFSMRAGEADKSVSVKDPSLTNLAMRIVEAVPLRGPIDIDYFYSEIGYAVLEINPRFGGTYLHAYGAGQNYVRYIIQNLYGLPNPQQIEDYEEGVVMLKYDQPLIQKIAINKVVPV